MQTEAGRAVTQTRIPLSPASGGIETFFAYELKFRTPDLGQTLQSEALQLQIGRKAQDGISLNAGLHC
jgi:hypothetical protein